jgi:hypothetical protein
MRSRTSTNQIGTLLSLEAWERSSKSPGRAGDVVKKVVLIIVGSLGGLYAIVGVVQFIHILLTSDPGTAYGTAHIAASVAPVCLGLIVCLACFLSVFRKPKP